MRIEKTVFVSYRRTNVFNALAIYQNLTANGFDVFFDYESIKSGDFGQIILNQIAARAHFVVLLTSSALERCNEPGDWLRREIEHAIDTQRNIVPLMFEGFSFNDAKQYLTGKMEVLPSYNAMRVPVDYFEAAMQRLRNEFLNIPLDVVIHPAPAADRAAVEQAQSVAAQQPTVTEEQLTAEEWFERALRRGKTDYDEKIADYDKVIELNPNLVEAYHNRATVYFQKGDHHSALADYNTAIRLEPSAATHYHRGLVRYALGDYDGAIDDFSKTIRQNPKHADAFANRGIARYYRRDYEKAITDYTQAILLNPRLTEAYRSRGAAYEKISDFGSANADYQRYIELGGKEIDKVRQWIETNTGRMRKQRQ